MPEKTLPEDSARNRVLALVRPEAREFLREKAIVKELKTGDVILTEGTPVTHVIFPHEGVISIVAEMDDGRSVEKSSVGNEGFVGLALIMGGGTSFGRWVVQVPGTASWVSIEDFDVALEKFHCVREIMLRYAKAHTLQLMESVACNSLHTAQQRIARWLLSAHDRVCGDTFYLTQESISKLLALRRATVNMVCSELMDSGAISYHRGSLTIADRQVLHSHACECYQRIRDASLPTGS